MREKIYWKNMKYGYFPKECQIIHRDIRPGNIIISNNQVYFIDFDYVAYGDLLFEIGSAAMLISDYKPELAKTFIKIYNSYSKDTYSSKDIFEDVFGYYIQSDFPIKLVNKVKDDILISFIEDRIRCLKFCEKVLKE